MLVATALQNEYELNELRERYRKDECIECFLRELTRIHSIMPIKYCMDLKTRKLTTVIESKWQEKIDNVVQELDKYRFSIYAKLFQPQLKSH